MGDLRVQCIDFLLNPLVFSQGHTSTPCLVSPSRTFLTQSLHIAAPCFLPGRQVASCVGRVRGSAV